ncbi:MAG: cupin domain-containing protein, partial [Bacillota bacterium]
ECTSPTETVYRTPAEEFELSSVRVAAGMSHRSGGEHSAEMLIVLEGTAVVEAEGENCTLGRGQIVLVPQGLGYVISARSEAALVYRAGLPRS